MREEKKKIRSSKENIEWDAVETIPILIYRCIDNFTLMSVYNKRNKVKWSYGGMLYREFFLFFTAIYLGEMGSNQAI